MCNLIFIYYHGGDPISICITTQLKLFLKKKFLIFFIIILNKNNEKNNNNFIESFFKIEKEKSLLTNIKMQELI